MSLGTGLLIEYSGRYLSRPHLHSRRRCNSAQHGVTVKAAAATGRVMGPEPPPARGKPDWVRILEEDAAVDEEVAQLLEGTGGDPDKIRAKMQQKLKSPVGAAEQMFQARTGSDVPPRVIFKEVDVFDMWVWLELMVPPSEREKELLQSCIRSWFVVGKLGGYNSQNMQVYYNNSDDNSFLDYDTRESAASFTSYMHECTDVEFKGSWARFHLDMGTADELAFDILINMLVGFSTEVAGITQVLIGGEHERWAVPAHEDDGMSSSGLKQEQAPKVGMNPMKLPEGVAEELELLDEIGEIYNSRQQQQPGGSVGFGGSMAGKLQGLRPVGHQPIKTAVDGSSSSSSGGSGSRGSSSSSGSSATSTRPRSRQDSRERLQQLQQQQQQQQQQEAGDLSGMTMYSPDEFRKAFNIRDDDDE